MSDTIQVGANVSCDTCPFKPKRCTAQLTITEDRKVYWKHQHVRVTVAELKVLEFLIANGGKVKHYRTIYESVYYRGFHGGNGESGMHSNVRSIIKRLRAKFKLVDPEFKHIVTHHGFGYAWEE